jgi:hypothetical protein
MARIFDRVPRPSRGSVFRVGEPGFWGSHHAGRYAAFRSDHPGSGESFIVSALAHREGCRVGLPSSGTESLQTHRWREMDSKFQFRCVRRS